MSKNVTTGFVAHERFGRLCIASVECEPFDETRLRVVKSEALLGASKAKGVIGVSDVHPTLAKALRALEAAMVFEVKRWTDVAALMQLNLDHARDLMKKLDN